MPGESSIAWLPYLAFLLQVSLLYPLMFGAETFSGVEAWEDHVCEKEVGRADK